MSSCGPATRLARNTRPPAARARVCATPPSRHTVPPVRTSRSRTAHSRATHAHSSHTPRCAPQFNNFRVREGEGGDVREGWRSRPTCSRLTRASRGPTSDVAHLTLPHMARGAGRVP
eukprot:4016290-Prymnesium_polylepis.1